MQCPRNKIMFTFEHKVRTDKSFVNMSVVANVHHPLTLRSLTRRESYYSFSYRPDRSLSFFSNNRLIIFFKLKKMQRSSTNTDDKQTEKDTTAVEKKKLLRQIRELNSIIEQCKWSLETLRFKNVEGRLNEPASLNVPSSLKNLPNVDVDLQNDLYRFAGLNCVNVHGNEVTFNFVSTSNEQEAKNKYAVQMFIKDGKGHLGKWVMPMSIDMSEILAKTPIDSLKNLNPFVRTCKHYIDCYTERQQQFLSLKHVSNMQHFNLQSNTGYTKISLELYGVHDCENDKYINIVVYLQYHSDRTRPHKIEVETNDKNILSNDAKQRLKVCLKEFKLSDLPTAFERVLANDSEFAWMRTDDSDSPLELHYSSDSDEEGFLEQLQSERKKSLRQAKKKQELRKKWNKRKRQRYTESKLTSDSDLEPNESNTEDSKRTRKKKQAFKDNSETNASHTENPREILRNKKKKASKDNIEATESHSENKSLRSGKKRKTSKDDSEADTLLTENSRENLRKGKKRIASILKQQQNIDKNLLEDDTPKVKNKLKQIKLNFQDHLVTSSGSAENSIFSPNLRNRSDKKATLITSTPLDRGRTSKTSYLEAINITDIEKPKKTRNFKNRELRNLRAQNNTKTLRKSPRLSRSPNKSVFS
ncbi:uncharacterized protein LOC109858236 isoform X2 [Pseudomyrmex gracilis]|uniref:uncharacterized protein LOC109858236 isoform X2 n=1 Tax=Pseudomyrmex gracilis TaxID=219809 RepID=UPI000994A72F|nr:uncharacterized protein LOC109858236 isoform X2 [Pseudomyrmex gracilis]